MVTTGPTNTICDVPGIRVGQAEDFALTTGVTVILPDEPAPAVVDHRGGGIGSRGSSVLAHGSTMPEVHAITLSGGSAFGLDAAGGVMSALREDGRGYQIGSETVPIVPCSIIFDLLTGGPKKWEGSPWWHLGKEAVRSASKDLRLGNAGGGMGATAADLKGGVGSASFSFEGCAIGALVVANPVGSVVIPGTDTFWSWQLEQADEMGGQRAPENTGDLWDIAGAGPTLSNTTLAVVATDAHLDRDQLFRIAVMAHDGIARAIRPVHSPLDGDTVYVLSTCSRPIEASPRTITSLGTMAADCVARAIARGVFEAKSLAGIPSYRERHATRD